MKKITLILVAIFAMVNVANAQRAWAYDLELTPLGDSYTFAFKAVTAGDATLVFYKEGVEAGTLNLGSVSAGDNTVTKTSEELLSAIGKAGDFTWGVKMSAEAIALSGTYLTELTAAGQGLDFYLPQGLVVDNNPESETFSTLFIAEAQGGTLSVGPTHKQGIYHYSQKLAELNPTDQGIIPSNVTLTNGNRQEMHRIAINPKNNHVAFAHNISGKPAVWSVPANNPAGEATNLIAGTAITMPNSICFDENGALYVMDNANATTGGTLYKVVDGVATKLVQNKTWQQVDNSLAYDGRGGIWIAQTSTGTTWPSYAILSHVNSSGEIDWSALDHSSEGLFSAANSYGYSQRGQCAYNTKEDLLVLGGNCRSHIFQVTYNAAGVPSLTLKYRTPYIKASTNIDGVAFDYAGDLYLMSAARERLYKYVVPTTNNTCTTLAPKAQTITLVSATPEHTVTISVNGNGTVTGANTGTYLEGTELTLTATPAEHYDFVNWTYGSENSTANPLTLTVNSDLTITANFQEHAKYTITASAADNTMGYVTGGGTYYAGETVTLKAVAKTGYYFTGWDDSNTDNPRTFTATEDVTLQANFSVAYPRVYAYDLDVVDNGDSYTFSFKPNTNAVSGNLLLYNEEGTAVVQTHAITTAIVAHTATSIILNKTELPNQADVPWAIQLSGNPIPAFAETFADADYRFAKGHAAVDNSPESEYFGRVYVADRRSTKSKSGFYVYNIDFTPLNTEANKLGMDKAGYSRPAVGADGTVYLTGYTDDESGIFVVDPADLTKCTQFYNGTRASNGLFTNGGAELGSSTSGVGAYGVGKDAVLYSMMEDGTGANANSGKQPIVKYQIGQSDGTVLKQWSTAPTWHINYPATGKDSYNFGNNAFAATEKGVWISQNKSNDADRPEIAFIDKEGVVQFMQNLNKSQGGGLAVNADNTVLYLQKAGEILEYNITWTGNTPALTLAKAYPVSLQYITTLSFDYAGNLIACAGTQYGSNTDNNVMKLVAYTLPTNDNTCTVPAAKAKALKLGVRYNVEVTVNDPAMGTVTGAGEYKENETAILTATPAEHHRFVNWTKGAEIVSTEATYSFAVTENITLTATFEAIPQYTITVSANDGEMGSVTGGGDYYEGVTATLTATAKGGYVFEKWSDDNTDNPRTITVGEAVTYTAIFKVAPARVFAYNLDVVDNGDETYTLSFIPNANATSGRVILYNDDTKAQIHEETIAGTIAKGVKSEVIINKSVLPAAGIVTWAVELTGEPVEKVTLLTKANDKANYGFNRPQGVAIDNNPASDYFGRMYIALPKAGGTGYSDTNYGIVVMDPLHNRLKSGVVANGDALGSNGRYSMHRVAVNPINGNVYYVRTSDSSEGVTGTAIYELTPDATNILTDNGTAKNVISGADDITNANSVCFDENGVMYVVANANYVDGASMGRVYKVVDGVATLFTPASIEVASKDNAIVPDGKGGFWAAQHRNSLDVFNHLMHINASGATDYYIDKNNNADLLPVQTFTSGGTTYNNASYRGQVAYYSIDENNGLVAYGGGAKVSVFKATYDDSGVPSLSAWKTISMVSQSSTAAIHVDGIAFDYAGNIVILSATDERMYQYALPIDAANTSLVPSPTSKTIKLGTLYNVEVTVNDNTMGIATGAGEYLQGETATLTATANTGYRFVNWTYGSTTSTDNPLSLVVGDADMTVTANFEPLPEIAYELNGGVWNAYGWTSKKDMYNALLDDWRAYYGSSRTNVAYENQLGVGKSSTGIPTTVASDDERVALWELFSDATYAPKWGWLAAYVDAVAATQYKKMDAANGVKTQPTSAAGVFTFTLGNFFGEDNAHSTDYIDAVDFTGEEAHITSFQSTWGQTFPQPTQPTSEVVLGTPVRDGYRFDGWYATSDFSGAEVTTVDENTEGTLYAKWVEHFYTRTVSAGDYGTICLSYGSSSYSGAEFYEIAYLELEADGTTPKGIWLDEVTTLEAGKPYIFKATADELVVYYEGEEVLSPVEGKAGLTGTFDGITDENVLVGNYMIANNKFWLCGTGCWLNANRAYIEHDALHGNTTPISPMPGRRRVYMGGAGENSATGTEDMIVPNKQVQKIIENGQLIIIRDGVKYNVQGVRL